jgi:hypothetical protein
VALLLRSIRKARWSQSPEWCDEGDLGADALNDLATKDNALSVWQIEQDESNLERVIAALAATRDYLSNFDLILFPEEIVADSGIATDRSEGVSADHEANARWHCDLRMISASKLASLARSIKARGTLRRILERQVGNCIFRGVQEGRIDSSSVSQSIRDHRHFTA